MNFLIDENLPLSFAEIIREMKYESAHVYEVGLDKTDDSTILEYASSHGQIIITFDLDFSRLVATGKHQLPSIITFRTDAMTASFFKNAFVQHIDKLREPLVTGAMVTITEHNIRVRQLPVG